MSFVMVAPDVVTKEIEFTPPGSEETASILVDFKWLTKAERHKLSKRIEKLMRRKNVSLQRYIKQVDAYNEALDAYLDKEVAGDLDGLVEPVVPELEEVGDDDAKIAREVVKGIAGLKDRAGNDLDYTPERLDELLAMEFVAAPFYEALRNYAQGVDIAAALQKN